MTLSDPEVKRAIEKRWVSTWHNQCPGLYCNNTADSRKPIPYPPEQLETVHEGAGGGNIRLFFCDPDGRIVHCVTGFLDDCRLLAEEEFAREQLPRTEEQRRNWCKGWERMCWYSSRPLGLPYQDEVDAHRARNLGSVPHGRDVWEVLREIEDNVYKKGAIG